MRMLRQIFPPVMIAVAFGASALAYPRLPARVPTHWDMSGRPNGFSDPIVAALLLPCVMLLVWGLLTVVPKFDAAFFVRYERRESDVSTVQPVYGLMVSLVLALLLLVHLYSMGMALGWPLPQRPVWLTVVLSAFAIVIGNYMPRVIRRNAFIGFRVPWAYASEEVWRRTQRAGGYGLTGAGVVGLMTAAIVPAVSIRVLAAAVVVAIVSVASYSYRLAHSRDVA
jgi:uncharacterized membrane protein